MLSNFLSEFTTDKEVLKGILKNPKIPPCKIYIESMNGLKLGLNKLTHFLFKKVTKLGSSPNLISIFIYYHMAEDIYGVHLLCNIKKIL